ncbi:trimeric [FeFe] hydrogenase, partial catalytic component, partial [Candidatus Gastranaerophilus sp. (ex Termes propinquus)]
GTSGGVAEAAVRTAYELVAGVSLSDINVRELRGVSTHSREVELDVKGQKIVIRVVSTINEAEKALQEIKDGVAKFQLLEVMACPGGCVNGGGQPTSRCVLDIEKRAEGLYREDSELKLRKSQENSEIKKLYEELLEKPGSHKSHELLHTTYKDCFAGSYRDIK